MTKVVSRNDLLFGQEFAHLAKDNNAFVLGSAEGSYSRLTGKASDWSENCRHAILLY